MSQIHETVYLGKDIKLGSEVSIWEYSKIENGVSIGSNSKIGRNVYIGDYVEIGSNCKIQNNSLIYSPSEISDGVFIGPGVILTNDKNPRATNELGTIKKSENWVQSKIKIEKGASIGAGVVCVAPITVGQWSVSGAGAVITTNFPDFALMAGIPARQIGWVCKCGYRLEQSSERMYTCSKEGSNYEIQTDGIMRERVSL